MTGKNALVLAGAGMLRDLAGELAGNGWRVVLPCRRYAPVPVPRDECPTGRAVWVQAHWDRPDELARHVAKTVDDAPMDLLVTWLHESYRVPVLKAVEPLLTPTAPIVEVRSMAALGFVSDPPEPDPLWSGRPAQQVVFGDVSAVDGQRALSQYEVVAGVLAAVDRALGGAPSSLHQIGEPRSRLHIPRPRVHWGAAVEATVPRPRVHSV